MRPVKPMQELCEKTDKTRNSNDLLTDTMKITNLTREIDEKTLQGNRIMGGREAWNHHVQCFFAMKTAEFFAKAMGNWVQIPEIKNKLEKYPWMVILRQASLFIFSVTKMKEVYNRRKLCCRDKEGNKQWLLKVEKLISFIPPRRWKAVDISVLKFVFQEEMKLRGRKGCKGKRETAGTHSCNYRKVISQSQHQVNKQRLAMRKNEWGRKNMV